MLQKETMTSREEIYNGKIINVMRDTVRFDNGGTAFRELVHHPGGVAIAALDENENLILVRQFRYPFGEALLEIPAGKLEPGEEPREAALRELLEETGTIPETFEFMGEIYPTVAYLDEKIRLFTASGLKAAEQHLDEDEYLDLVRMPLEEAYRLVTEGKIPDSKTQIAVLRLWAERH